MVIAWLSFAFSAQSRVMFPLRTLSNLLAALREGDFSIRARGANREDVLGEVLWEVNALGETLRKQTARRAGSHRSAAQSDGGN